MPRFAAGQEPLVLSADSAVDLIVERRGGGVYCAGLSVKAKHAAEGKAYIQYLASPAVGSLLAGKGMEPPKGK